jgi:hypothetical protein
VFISGGTTTMYLDKQVTPLLDAARGQKLNVVLYDHRHGTDVFPFLAPVGVTMTKQDAIDRLDEGTWEPDRDESMECEAFDDGKFGILQADDGSYAYDAGPGQ